MHWVWDENEFDNFWLVSFGCEDFSGISENAERGECVGTEKKDLGYQFTQRACRLECHKYGSIHGDGCCELQPYYEDDLEEGYCYYFVDGQEKRGNTHLTMKCAQGALL